MLYDSGSQRSVQISGKTISFVKIRPAQWLDGFLILPGSVKYASKVVIIKYMKKTLLLPVIFCLFFLNVPPTSAGDGSWTLLEKVREAQERLDAYKIPKPAKLQKNESRIALAALDRATGEIKTINISLIGKTVKVLNAEGWRVVMKSNNGVNSEFSVASPENKLVLAMKYPVTLRKMTAKGEIRYPADVVYSAYSKELEAPEVVANGQAYVDNMIGTAYDKLAALKIMSRAFPDKLLVDVLDRQMVESLILIEHIGTTALLGDFDGALRRLYTTFGLNTVNTFDYSRSSAGARGIAQFMPKTYKALRQKRPELSLTAYFEEAMMDHENATLAQIAFMDMQLAALPPDVRERTFSDPVQIGEYLAASYNGGINRVLKTIKSWGEGWSGDHAADIRREDAEHVAIEKKISSLKAQIKKAKTTAEAKKLRAQLAQLNREHLADWNALVALKAGTLRNETVNYLRKLRPVYAHLSVRQEMIERQDLAMREAVAAMASSTAADSATSTVAVALP